MHQLGLIVRLSFQLDGLVAGDREGHHMGFWRGWPSWEILLTPDDFSVKFAKCCSRGNPALRLKQTLPGKGTD